MARVRGQISKTNHDVLMCRSTEVLVSRNVSDEGKRCLKFSAAVVGENRRSVNKRKGPEIWDRFFPGGAGGLAPGAAGARRGTEALGGEGDRVPQSGARAGGETIGEGFAPA